VDCIVSPGGTDGLSSLKNLEALSVDNCQLPSRFWDQLSKAKTLKSLLIDSCDFPEQGVSWPQLPQLESLTINNAWFGDEDLKQMGSMPRLTNLDLSNTDVAAEGFRFAATHAGLSTNLKTLYLIEVEGANEMLRGNVGLADFLAKHKSLSWLSVRGLSFSNDDLAKLEACSNLDLLDIASTKVSSAGFATLTSLPSLDTLDVSNLDLKDEDVRQLADLDLDLVELSLNGNPISADALQHLMEMPLQLLDVSDCNFSAEVVRQFLKDHPTCESVIDGELDDSEFE